MLLQSPDPSVCYFYLVYLYILIKITKTYD